MAGQTSGADALQMRRVGMRFGSVWVLQDVDYAVPAGNINALVGHNGAGKSTMMKIVLGGYRPTTGAVLIGGTELTEAQPSAARRLGVGMVLQERSLIGPLTGLDNIFLNAELTNSVGLLNRRRETAEAEELLSRLDISPDVLRRTVSDMSAVQRQMVEIAKAMRLATTLLILDEPTAPLSHNEIDALFRVIRNAAATGTGIVLITHHLGEVFAISDHVTVLREGSVTLSARTASTDMDSLVSAMLGPGRASMTSHQGRSGDSLSTLEPAFAATGLRVGEKLDAISFSIQPGEVLGVAGLVGSGRTTLLRTIFGDVRPTGGRMTLHGQRYAPRSPSDAIGKNVFLIPEDRHAYGLLERHSIGENVVLPVLRRLRAGLLFSRSKARALADGLMRLLDVRARGAQQVVGELSGGNQQKVVLAKALAAEAELLLLDEPTFGVDIGASRELIQHIRGMADTGKAVLWVTSDLQELLAVSDRIVVLADGTIRATVRPDEPDYTESFLIRSIQRDRSPGSPPASPRGWATPTGSRRP